MNIKSVADLHLTSFCTVCKRAPDVVITGTIPDAPFKQFVKVQCHGQEWTGKIPAFVPAGLHILVPPPTLEIEFSTPEEPPKTA